MLSLHLRRIVEELLGDHFVAAPGLQRDFLHDPRRPVILGRELEAPVDRGAVAVDEYRAQPRGLDPGDRSEHRGLAGGKHVAAVSGQVLVFSRGCVDRVEALNGADMVVGFNGGGEGFGDMTIRHRGTPYFGDMSIFVDGGSKVTPSRRPRSGISACKNACLPCLAAAEQGSRLPANRVMERPKAASRDG